MSIQLQCDTKSGEQPIFKSDDGRCLAVDEKPTCVWLPGYLGGDRVTVLDTFMIKNCRCGTHPAKVQIFEGKYMVKTLNDIPLLSENRKKLFPKGKKAQKEFIRDLLSKNQEKFEELFEAARL